MDKALFFVFQSKKIDLYLINAKDVNKMTIISQQK